LDLSAVRKTRLSGWISYDLESGWDYLYIEYSLNGGLTWVQMPILSFSGTNVAWKQFGIDTPFLDHQAAVQIRFRLLTDSSVTHDGVYLDDLTLDYEPRACYRYIFPLMYH
jgi:immune inhibitor A